MANFRKGDSCYIRDLWRSEGIETEIIYVGRKYIDTLHSKRINIKTLTNQNYRLWKSIEHFEQSK